mgnify:CR=1 FL=1
MLRQSVQPVLSGEKTFSLLRSRDLFGKQLVELIEAAAFAHRALDQDACHGSDDQSQLLLDYM